MATYNSSFSDSSEMVAGAKQYATGYIEKLATCGLLDRDEYMGKIKGVFDKWVDNANYSTSVDDGIRYLPPGARLEDRGIFYAVVTTGESPQEGPLLSADEIQRHEAMKQQLDRINYLIEIIESANNFDFVEIDYGNYEPAKPIGLWASSTSYSSAAGPAVHSGTAYCFVDAQKYASLEASYNELVDALYYGLALETRLKPYMDTIVMTPGGADLSGLKQMLADRWAEDRLAAYGDLADLVHSGGNVLRDLGWEPLDLLREWSAYAKNDPELSALMAILNVVEGAIGTSGRDILLGQDAAEWMRGKEGHDIIDGGKGHDTIYGDLGDDTLLGGEGSDALHGGGGSDVLTGGVGNDYLYGEAGNDIYRFSRGDGQDSGYDYDTSAGNKDVIELGAGISTSDVRITRSGDYMILNILGSTDKVTVSHYFYNDGDSAYLIEEIRFADGSVWDLNTIKSMAIKSTSGNDSLYGYATADTISGGAGNDYIYGKAGDDLLMGNDDHDYLYGEAGNDTLMGGAGNDYLYGGDGNDLLIGGLGNDSLQGNAGNDTYRLDRGDGQDSVYDYDTTAANVDTLVFGAGISTEQLWFRKVGSNLEVSIIGTEDKMTVSNWYSNTAYRVEQFKTHDGDVLTDGDVQTLVDAMAAFTVPVTGQTVLPDAYQQALAPVIAGCWDLA